MQRTIAILTTCDWLDPAYSLTSVIVDQVTALVRNGEKVVIFVLTNFNTPAHATQMPEGVEIRAVFPRFALVDYAATKTLTSVSYFPKDGAEEQVSFDTQTSLIREALEKHGADITHFFAHDLIFQGWFLPYAVALHQYASTRPDAKFFHWVHSFPGGRPSGTEPPHTARFTLPAHSKLVYLNHHDTIALAEAYSTIPGNVVVIPNSYDPTTVWNLHPLTAQIIKDSNLLDADVVSVYPVSTPRMDGKQVPIVIKLHAAMKRLGKKTVLVIPNAHAYKNEQMVVDMQRLAQREGLGYNEVIFTSQYDGYSHGVPKQVVNELFRLSDTFIFPSTSEVCSLVLLEAMAAKNLLVLNKSWPSLYEFGGEHALYFHFGANGYPLNLTCDPERYWHDIAVIILGTLKQEKALGAFRQVLKKHNLSTLYTEYLRPLLVT